MKIVQPSSTIIPYNSHPQKHIEEIARTCYKSEDLITETSHEKFILNLVNRGHWAMLEHFIFVYEVSEEMYDSIKKYSAELNIDIRYMQMTKAILDLSDTPRKRCLISYSARTILDMNKSLKEETDRYMSMIDNSDKLNYYNTLFEMAIRLQSIVNYIITVTVKDYKCPELFSVAIMSEIDSRCMDNISMRSVDLDELEHKMSSFEFMRHGWKSARIICDRGVTHEIVRHRDGGHAQESTRYCTYSKDKFDGQISVIDPAIIVPKDSEMYSVWMASCEFAERSYFAMLNEGASAQTARSVLPNSLKSEICCTFRNYEWCHFFELRCDKAAHPQMRQVAIPLYRQFIHGNKIYQRYTKGSENFEFMGINQ